MSDILYFLQLPTQALNVGGWENPSRLTIIVLLFTAIGTYILSRKVSGTKTVTAPICFWVLFGFAMAANRFLGPYHLPRTNELQHIIIYTTIGVALGSVVLLATLRVATRGEG